MATCTHLDDLAVNAPPGTEGCVDCLTIGGTWVHLRRCLACGHVGCCDSSPKRHATAHFAGSNHPLVQSFEPHEDWVWCYIDQIAFEVDALMPGASHP